MRDIHIAMDWAQSTFAMAWDDGNGPEVFESRDGIAAVKHFLEGLTGNKKMTIEEGTASQWLFTEIKPLVNELIVCNTRRNRLLSEGAKNDRIDALKLLKLLKADLLKPVYHTFNKSIELRKLVSGYSDFVRATTRLKNQKSAILRSVGEDKKTKTLDNEFKVENLLLETISEQIEVFEKHQKMMKTEFDKVRSANEDIQLLESIPGIGQINSVRIAAAIVDAQRFKDKGSFLSYSGLVKHERSSGGKSYGHRSFSYHRGLKQAFKTAVLVNIQEGRKNYFNDYYQSKIKQEMPAHDARNATARRIATVALGVLKSRKKFSSKHLKSFAD